jgi:hypothetical protein
MHVREFMTAPAVTLIRLVAMAVPGVIRVRFRSGSPGLARRDGAVSQ